MKDIDLYLPFPPSVNNYYCHTRNGTRIKKAGIRHREETAIVISETFGGVPAIAHSIAVTLILYPPDKRRRDLDNSPKCLLDSLTHSGLWVDDSLIDQLTIYRGKVAPPSGFVFVRVSDSGCLAPVNNPSHFLNLLEGIYS